MDGVGAGGARPRPRRRRCRAGRAPPGRRCRARRPRSRADRRCGRCAARSRRDWRRTGARSGLDGRLAGAGDASNASNATRQRPPTRLAGSTPRSIQRWTVRVDVPSRFATSLGPVPRASVAIVASQGSADQRLRGSAVSRVRLRLPSRSPLLVERGKALAGLLGHALAGDDPGGVPLRRAVAQAADLADDRLGRARRGRARRQEVRRRRHRPRASSASSPSTTSWTRPIRWARTASNRRPPGNSARAWLSPILAMTNGEMTAGRIPSRVSVKPKRRAALGDDEVRHGAQAHPAAERRALDARDDRHRARVDGLEHVGHAPSRPARCPRRRAPSPRASSRCRRRHRTTGRRRPGRRRGGPSAYSRARAANVVRSSRDRARHRTRCGPPGGPASPARRAIGPAALEADALGSSSHRNHHAEALRSRRADRHRPSRHRGRATRMRPRRRSSRASG